MSLKGMQQTVKDGFVVCTESCTWRGPGHAVAKYFRKDEQVFIPAGVKGIPPHFRGAGLELELVCSLREEVARLETQVKELRALLLESEREITRLRAQGSTADDDLSG